MTRIAPTGKVYQPIKKSSDSVLQVEKHSMTPLVRYLHTDNSYSIRSLSVDSLTDGRFEEIPARYTALIVTTQFDGYGIVRKV